MRNTKIIVVHAKHIIKSSLAFVIGLAIIAALFLFFFPKNNNNPSARFTPGVYSSTIVLHSKPVNVLVSVDQNKILSVKLYNFNQSQNVFYPLFKPTMDFLSKQIIQYQSVNIPTSNDNATTEKILLSAVDNALQQAKIY